MRVTGAWSQLLIDWLDREKLAALPARALLAPYASDDVVPLHVWRDALDLASTLRADLPAPGLLIGTGVSPRHVGVLGYLVLASDNIGEALSAYQRYERLLYGVDRVEVVCRADEIEMRWTPDNAGVLADELALAALVTFIRQQIDNPSPPSRICFRHTATAERALACEKFFGCPVVFGDACSRVHFHASFLGIALPHSEPGLHALLESQAEALINAMPHPNVFDRAVQQLLVRMLPDGEIGIEKVAQKLNQSSRTLQRRLASRSMTWQQLLDRTREQLARQYLRDPALSLAEIALLLGFSEQSTFTRAFRRWTGTTPLSYRKGSND